MTSTRMKRWLAEPIRRRPLGLACAAIVAIAPKCLLCVLAYAGAGAAFGIGGPEICGGTNAASRGWAFALVACVAVAGVFAFQACRQRRASKLEAAPPLGSN